jgi:hypothetical protein
LFEKQFQKKKKASATIFGANIRKKIQKNNVADSPTLLSKQYNRSEKRMIGQI